MRTNRGGKDVLQEEARERLAAEGAVRDDVPIGAVLVAEGGVLAVVAGDAGVGDRDPVDVRSR